MKKIQKGIIAAAGLTSRFLPASKGCPKGLIPIGNKPVIHYLVEEMLGADIKQIGVVHSPGDNRIKKYFSHDPELTEKLKKTDKKHMVESLTRIQKNAEFRFIPQSTTLPYGSGSPILAAKNFIDQEPFVVTYADDVIAEAKPGTNLKQMISLFLTKKAAGVIAAQKVARQETVKYGCFRFHSDPKRSGQVMDIIEKPPLGQAPSSLVNDGRFVLSPKIFGIITKTAIRQSELMLTDAITTLAQNYPVYTHLIKPGRWLTTGDPLNWLKANLTIMSQNPKTKKELKGILKG